MRYAFFILFIFLAKASDCQDITGIWRGNFRSSNGVLDMFDFDNQYKLEVQVDQQNKSFNGVTYSYKTSIFYGKAVANGTVNPKTGKVFLQELKIVEVKMQQNSYACVMTYFLQYSKNGDEEFLEGRYTSFRENDSTPCGKGTVYLRKVTTSDFYKEPFLVKRENRKVPIYPGQKKTTSPYIAKNAPPKVTKPEAGKVTKPPAKKNVAPPVAKSTPKTTPPPISSNPSRSNSSPERTLRNKTMPGIAQTDSIRTNFPVIKKSEPGYVPKPLATRENELVKTFTINTNQISINIYDNGTIDHDTVSVYMDKKLVISKQMLTASPITINLKMDEENSYHELVMVAENLGDIPPNTSLMVIKAGQKEYEVRITSTEQKNAVVIFKYEKN